MGLAMSNTGKAYLIGGKLRAWSTGESQYSWRDNGRLNSDYSKDKGNDDMWELDLRYGEDTRWTLRVPSLYGNTVRLEEACICLVNAYQHKEPS